MVNAITGGNMDPDKPEPEKSDGDSAVGHGKPPQASSFQKGNKHGKGRVKGSKNLGTIVNEALGMKMTAKVDGKVKKVTKIELALHQLANKSAGGDLNAIGRSIELYDRFGPQEDPSGPSPAHMKADLATLRAYLQMRDMYGE